MDFSRMMISWVPFLAMMIMVCKCFGADSGGSDQTISQVLAQYGLPIGLLPDSVKSYSLGNDGSFQVELNGPCYVQFNYLVYYEKTVAGKLSYGKITDLEGIQAKQLFLWVSITGMEVDLPSADYIYFNVGFVSKKIEISWFESVHTCKNSLGNEPCKEIEVALTEERLPFKLLHGLGAQISSAKLPRTEGYPFRQSRSGHDPSLIPYYDIS